MNLLKKRNKHSCSMRRKIVLIGHIHIRIHAGNVKTLYVIILNSTVS